MQFWELVLIGISLSMDAFAVALCQGLSMPRVKWGRALLVAGFFGGFQALMPLCGFYLGRQFERFITSADHWIAFGLLVFIGGKMLFDALTEKKGDEPPATAGIWQLFMLAIATSIDALAVGITFGFLDVDIFSAIAIIGVTTFLLSLGGVFVGNRFGIRYRKPAAIAGGCVLILLGAKILLEHLGVLVF